MKAALLLPALLLWQASPQSAPSIHQDFRYRRIVTLPAAPGPACAVLDPALFPHAAPSLKDLRLYGSSRGLHDPREIPFVITLSEPRQPDPDPAQVRNLTLRNRDIVFDLEMPHRPYTEVTLDLAGHNFVVSATVSGTRDSNYRSQTPLGEFTLFDLASQHLSRNTTFQLQETDLPYLHVELAVFPAPGSPPPTLQALLGMVQGVTVPPSREAQSLYTTALATAHIRQSSRQSIASFTLPARIPIERVSFDLAPAYKPSFSRPVHISDYPGTAPPPSSAAPGTLSETSAGTIFRVHLTEEGHPIDQQQLSVPATLGSNLQSPAIVTVTVDNGDDPPLPLTAIRLEMRQRKLCFNTQNGLETQSQPGSPPESLVASELTLFYGDPALPAPQYDGSLLFASSPTVHNAKLGPEQLNPAYRNPPDSRPFTERHPRLLFIVLLAILCLLLATALRTSRHTHHH